MRKIKFILLMLSFILSLTACSNVNFDGSRTGNESEFIMKYRILNGTDSQALELGKGDFNDAKVVNDSGKLSIKIQKDEDEPIYDSKNISLSNNFQVEAEESGTYTITVTGEKAKGSVSFMKRSKTEIELELTENYDTNDPFVHEKLFYVSDDSETLDLDMSFQMEGESGEVEIANNKTGEVFWSDVWEGKVEPTVFTATLHNLKKECEYVIRFTGMKIKYARVLVTSESPLFREREMTEK